MAIVVGGVSPSKTPLARVVEVFVTLMVTPSG
jgi:hypothetical protein